MALNEFEGTVMLVSHDRALLREVCDEFWLVGNGRVQPFDGDLDDYQRWLLEVSRALARGLPPPPPPQPQRAEAPPTLAAPAPAAATAAPARAAPVRPPAPTSAPAREDRKSAKQDRTRRSDASRPLRAEVQRIDGRLAALAGERAEVERLLAAPATRREDFAELGRRLAHVQAEIAMLEERWLALQTELEGLQG